jgi:hypothetical protein
VRASRDSLRTRDGENPTRHPQDRRHMHHESGDACDRDTVVAFNTVDARPQQGENVLLLA